MKIIDNSSDETPLTRHSTLIAQKTDTSLHIATKIKRFDEIDCPSSCKEENRSKSVMRPMTTNSRNG